MAGTLMAKLSLPVLSPPKTSLLTPLSAVAPPRSVAASRLQILVTLETICEEEEEDDDNEKKRYTVESANCAISLKLQTLISSIGLDFCCPHFVSCLILA